MKRAIAITATAILTAPAAQAFPVVGGNGLCANAQNLLAYLESTYPAVLSVGGVRPDAIADHPTGHALDVIVGGNTALGDTINADVLSQSSRFGVKYTIWQQTEHMPSGAAMFMANRGSATANHRDHVHVSVY